MDQGASETIVNGIILPGKTIAIDQLLFYPVMTILFQCTLMTPISPVLWMTSSGSCLNCQRMRMIQWMLCGVFWGLN